MGFRLVGVAAAMAIAVGTSGCAQLLGGGDKAVPTFDLTAPSDFKAPRSSTAQLVVAAPSALQVLDTERIVVEPKPGQVAYLEKAQWSDRLPALFQARLIQSFENGSRGRAVGRAGDAITPDYTLLTDIRTFGIQAFDGSPEAVVEVYARIVGSASGRIVAGRLFTARVAAAGTAGPDATQALDTASDKIFVEIVDWASGRY
ncbi:cholesterol transport system auxiliary component [Angulomicrobium tetraedrale]|uniref:Cholesterol transport system auxiliary component n=1 Tax=Ancylobacter tetraedralis TaxID=217068 RepID=A0A839ZDH1_9HYPH|nr:ABC-type transport auxiliary lipoprotein family protein [Ancylobacter tetraedralis]MBB3772843.1 cholesterol transport system auxiliary component [Ancylobacter tetraedralis]